MKRLLSLLLFVGLLAAPFGCASKKETPVPDTSAELGDEGTLDKGMIDAGSTTGAGDNGPALPRAEDDR